MIRMMTWRWAGLGPRGTRLRDIVGSDGQRAWVPGIRINQFEFLCGPTAGGSGVYDCGGKPRGDTLSRLSCHSVTSAKGKEHVEGKWHR